MEKLHRDNKIRVHVPFQFFGHQPTSSFSYTSTVQEDLKVADWVYTKDLFFKKKMGKILFLMHEAEFLAFSEWYYGLMISEIILGTSSNHLGIPRNHRTVSCFDFGSNKMGRNSCYLRGKKRLSLPQQSNSEWTDNETSNPSCHQSCDRCTLYLVSVCVHRGYVRGQEARDT